MKQVHFHAEFRGPARAGLVGGRRFWLGLGLLAVHAVAVGSGCGRSSLLGNGGFVDNGDAGCTGAGCVPDVDMAGCELTHSCLDLSVRDLTMPVDVAGCRERGDCPDLSQPPDFARPADLRVPPDLAGCQVTGTCPDLVMPPDLALRCDQRKEICDDGIDNNCDGLIDCFDPECAGNQACVLLGQEICANGLDDDDNGLTDCQDPACASLPECLPHTCDPNHVDCTDPACVNNPACQNLVCMPTVHFGSLAQFDAKSERLTSTVGTTDVTITPCAPGGGGMVVSDFTIATDDTSMTLSYVQPAGADHVFGLFQAGIGQACNANWIDCLRPDPGTLSGAKPYLLNAGHYYLIIQAFQASHQGTADVTLTTTSSTAPTEICNDGVDNNGNGLVDCADPTCFSDPLCAGKECTPSINVGTVVVGTPGQMTSFTTVGAAGAETTMCLNMGGSDVVVEFNLKETAGVGLNWDQMGDHAVALYAMPPPGKPCDFDELSCVLPPDPGDSPMIAWGDLPPGNYLFVFKAHQPGDEGEIDATIYAYQNRKVELCHNGIDDDGNGFIDCADPACFTDPGCGSQICMPDVDLGVLHIGDSQNVTVDVTQGILNETVSCAMGGGKSKIVQLTLAENAGLGVDCTQSGQQVLGLYSEAGSREGCDKHELECADPNIIPFGCDFEIPNLQPGIYYVIFQAFESGTEGSVNITLSSIKDRVLEVCDNQIDDDMDGFTDCEDRKCFLAPVCLTQACMPQKVIDPMPLDGSIVKVSLDTTLATPPKLPSAKPPCETVPGGGTAQFMINMPGEGTLDVAFAQAFNDNHVFALYPDLFKGSTCDSQPATQCVPTGGGAAGMVSFPGLAAGKYWFVVAADKPGDEGPIYLELSGSLGP